MSHEAQPVNPTNPDQPQPDPLRTAMIVIYATFALLAVTIPQSLVNWLGDMRNNPVQEVLLREAQALQSLAEQTGIATPYRRAHELFNAATGHDDN
jgi:hypothetical protein